MPPLMADNADQNEGGGSRGHWGRKSIADVVLSPSKLSLAAAANADGGDVESGEIRDCEIPLQSDWINLDANRHTKRTTVGIGSSLKNSNGGSGRIVEVEKLSY